MPTADLLALAERLGQMRRCECLEGCERCCAVPWSPDGQRLPTETEVRAAIFETGWTFITVHTSLVSAAVDVWAYSLMADAMPTAGTCERGARATAGEAASVDLVLLALLRALEAARGT